VRFYKLCTLAASESQSEFDRMNSILRLKSRRASLYSVKVIKMSRLAIARLLFYSRFTGPFIVEKQTAQLFCL